MTLTDTDATKADLAEALAHLCAHAKRQQYIVHVPNDEPTRWDCAHAHVNDVLTAWEAAKA